MILKQDLKVLFNQVIPQKGKRTHNCPETTVGHVGHVCHARSFALTFSGSNSKNKHNPHFTGEKLRPRWWFKVIVAQYVSKSGFEPRALWL